MDDTQREEVSASRVYMTPYMTPCVDASEDLGLSHTSQGVTDVTVTSPHFNHLSMTSPSSSSNHFSMTSPPSNHIAGQTSRDAMTSSSSNGKQDTEQNDVIVTSCVEGTSDKSPLSEVVESPRSDVTSGDVISGDVTSDNTCDEEQTKPCKSGRRKNISTKEIS